MPRSADVPDHDQYKIVSVSILGRTNETTIDGYFAERLADGLFRDLKGDKTIRYAVLFHGPSIRQEHPKLEPVAG